MEIISRQIAIAKHLSSYFTGVPCKNNHIAKRYTTSSVCAECVHPKFDSIESIARAERKRSRACRLAAKKRLVRRGFILKSNFVETFQLLAFATSILREPSLKMGDILTARSAAGLGIDSHCIFKIFPEDEEYLKGLTASPVPPGESEAARWYRETMKAIGDRWTPEGIARVEAEKQGVDGLPLPK
jgi:hypothetical protein